MRRTYEDLCGGWTGRGLLHAEMNARGDVTPVIAYAPNETIFDEPFHEESIMLAWTRHRVYFPVKYDGVAWIESAPRDPGPNGQGAVGGNDATQIVGLHREGAPDDGVTYCVQCRYYWPCPTATRRRMYSND